jgi:hypothetical protein
LSELAIAFVITALTYVVTGGVPPIVAHYGLGVRFIGGTWFAILVGLIVAVVGGLIAVLVPNLPDLIVVANAVDIVPPLIASVAMTTVHGVISKSNGA